MTRRQRKRRHERRRLAAGAGFALGASLAIPAIAHAADYEVNQLGDSGASGAHTLRDAINFANANPGTHIVFASGLSGTISLGNPLPTIIKPVEILGPGANKVTVRGDGYDSDFYIDMTTTSDPVTISGLKITNGGHNPTLPPDGGAIHNIDSTLTVSNDVITGNRGGRGGGIFTLEPTTISGSTIRDNDATDNGGGVGAYAALSVTGSTIADNHTRRYGGGVYSPSPVNITGSTISGNSGNYGGGVYSHVSTLSVTDSSVSGNSAIYAGGGLWELGGQLTLSGSTVSGNFAGGKGGGVYARANTSGGPASISSSSISGNIAYDAGGAFIRQTGTITGSTVSDNAAVGTYAGGLYLVFSGGPYQGPPTISNTTISGNSAATNGGGAYVYGTGLAAPSDHATFESTTIAGNSAQTGEGGGVDAFGGNTSTNAGPALSNTIVAGNASASGGADLHLASHSGPFTTAFSLIQNAPSSTFVPAASDVLGVDPRLGPLASNGGPTQTRTLGSDSPALDTGSTALTNDQRGFARPVDQAGVPNAAGGNGSDIGAFELSSLPLPAMPATPAAALPKLTFGTLKFGPGGATVSFTCTGADCGGLATLTTTEKLQGKKIVSLARKKKRARRKNVIVGQKAFSLGAGKTQTLTVPLNSKGKALLKKFGKLPVNLAVTLKQPGGNAAVVKTAKSVVKGKKKKRRSSH